MPPELIVALAARVERLAASTDPSRRTLIGIAGAPGSGKSTLAAALACQLAGNADWRGTRVAHLPMDGFHLADVELARLGLADRKGAPETFDVAGYRSLLERVRSGANAYAPAFERALEQPVAGALPVVEATRTVLSEGNYLLLRRANWSAVRAQFDEVWFCRVDEARRRERLLERHVRHGRSPAAAAAWVDRVDEPNARLVLSARAAADLIVDLP